MNQGRYKAKTSKIERILNFFLFVDMVIMLSLGLALAIACYQFNIDHWENYSYLFEKPGLGHFGLAWRAFFSFYLILNAYMPLDLMVSLEFVKFIYTSIMQNDAEMKEVRGVRINSKKTEYEIKGLEAHTLSLHEDLAEIEYIFSDKTGTLTKNELIFRSLSILSGEKVFKFNIDEMKDEKNFDSIKNVDEVFQCIMVC